MPNRAATAAWYGTSANVIPQQNIAARQATTAAVGAATAQPALVQRAKILWPYVAAGLVIIAVLKVLEEKYIIHDESELRGLRISWSSFIKVGLMAMVFALGVQVIAGGVAHAQIQAAKPATPPMGAR